MRSWERRRKRLEKTWLRSEADLSSVSWPRRVAERSGSSKGTERTVACLAQRPKAALETAWRQRRPVRVRCWQRDKSLMKLELTEGAFVNSTVEQGVMDCSFMAILSSEIFVARDFKSCWRFLRWKKGTRVCVATVLRW